MHFCPSFTRPIVSLIPFPASDKASHEPCSLLEKTSTRLTPVAGSQSPFWCTTGLYISISGKRQISQSSLAFRLNCRNEGSGLMIGHLLVACQETNVWTSENLEGCIIHSERVA